MMRIRQLAAMRATVDTPAEHTRGVYCYGERERARRRRQIVDGIIKVGYVPSLRVRRATGENWRSE